MSGDHEQPLADLLDFVRTTGTRVFPMEPVPTKTHRAAKRPLITSWGANATTDPHQILRWHRQWPWALWGAITARFMVLDFDRRGLMHRFLRDVDWPEPRTWIAMTPRGSHLYTRRVKGWPSSTGKLGDGIDVLVGKRCVVLPFGDGGRRLGYSWLRHPAQYPLLKAPPRVRRALLATVGMGDARDTARKRAFLLPTSIPEGTRDETLFRLGCSLRGKGHDDLSINMALHEANETACVTPLEARQVEKIVRQVVKYDVGDGNGRLRVQGPPAISFPPWTPSPPTAPPLVPRQDAHRPSNLREADLDHAVVPQRIKALARTILKVLRGWETLSPGQVLVSYPTLAREVRLRGHAASKPLLRRALELLGDLQLIALPLARARQTHGLLRGYFVVGVSHPPSESARFVEILRG